MTAPPRPIFPRKIKQTITPSKLGYYVRTTNGIGLYENGTVFAFTLRGARRKADRARRRIEADRARQDAALGIDNGALVLPDLRSTGG